MEDDFCKGMKKDDIRATDYDIWGIVKFAIARNIDITPPGEKEWKMLAYAFRKLGLDEFLFVACSKVHGTAERASRDAYRYAKQGYYTEEQAATKILYFAKEAGIKIKDFLSDEAQEQGRAYTPPTKAQKSLNNVMRILREDNTATDPNKPNGDFLPIDMLQKIESVRNKTTLYKFLYGVFGSKIDSSFVAYHVGGCRWMPKGVNVEGLSSAFPLIDIDGNLCDFQLSPFDSSGHGVKYPNGTNKVKSWALAELYPGEDSKVKRAKWCFFGEHLLRERPTAKVGIVEAPKTAIITSILYPEYVWLACLSCAWLDNAIKTIPLVGREVWLFPDRDSVKLWGEKAESMRLKGLNVGVSNYLELNPGEPKDDLADIILRQQGKKVESQTTAKENISPDKAEAVRAWEQLKQENPFWCEIESMLDLEPISVTSLKQEAQ